MSPSAPHYTNPLFNAARNPAYGGCKLTRAQIWCRAARMQMLPSFSAQRTCTFLLYRRDGTWLVMESTSDSSSPARAPKAHRCQCPAGTSSDPKPSSGSIPEPHGVSSPTLSLSNDQEGLPIETALCPPARCRGRVPRTSCRLAGGRGNWTRDSNRLLVLRKTDEDVGCRY